MTGGELGKSWGNANVALKNPPSYNVSGGPTIKSSQLKIFSSSPKPTETPSGGFFDSSVDNKNEKELCVTTKRQCARSRQTYQYTVFVKVRVRNYFPTFVLNRL